MATEAGAIKISLILGSAQFTAGVQKAGAALNNFQKNIRGSTFNMSSFGGAMRTAMAAFTVQAVASYALEISKLGGKLQVVEAAFNRLAQPTLLDDLKGATKNTVAEITLMEQAVKASNLGVPVEKLATAFEFARRVAAETGENVDFLVNSIVIGVGRESPKIIDNLGISTKLLSERVKETGNFADAAFGIMEERLKDMGPEMDNAQMASEQLGASWSNLSAAVGKLLSPALKALADASALTADDLTLFFKNTEKLSFWEKIVGFLTAGTDGFDDIRNKLKPATKAVKENADALLPLNEQLKKLRFKLKLLPKDSQSFADATARIAEILDVQAKAHERTLPTIAKYREAISILEKELEGAAIGGEDYLSIEKQLIVAKEKLALATGKEKEAEKASTKSREAATKAAEDLKKHLESIQFAELKDPFGNVIEPLVSLPEDLDKNIEAMRELAKVFGIEMPDAVQKTVDAFKEVNEIEKQVASRQLELETATASMSEAFGSTFKDSLASFGAVLFDTIASGADATQTLVTGIFSAFAGMLRQLGEIAMTTGIALLGIRQALKTINPAVAIAAGVALIALSAVVTKGIGGVAPALATGGLAFGPTLAMVGDNPRASVDPEVIAPLSKLSGMGGKVQVQGEFILHGDTLRAVIRNSEKRDRFT